MRSKKNLALISILIVAGLLVTVGIFNQVRSGGSSAKPSYQTILPSDKSIDDLGGWQRVSPPKNEPVYAYADEINGVAITVSQQPLPKSFQKDTDIKVAEVAKNFNATNEIDAGDTKVYLGTSAKGPQSVILTKNNLLILIKSDKKIDGIAWIDYVNSLHPEPRS